MDLVTCAEGRLAKSATAPPPVHLISLVRDFKARSSFTSAEELPTISWMGSSSTTKLFFDSSQ